MRTTSAPSNPDGRGLEPNGPEDVPCAVLGPFSLIDRQGCEVLFRPLVQADRPTAARLFPGLSAQTRFRRFNSLYANLTDKQLTSLFDLDYRDRFAWAVEIACDGMTAPVAVGRYTRYAGSRRADVGITIRDQWHGRGLGGSLLDPLVITAHHNGFVAFDTIVTADNQPRLHLLRQRGAELSIPTTGEVDAVLPLSGIIGQLTDHPLARMLTTATTAPSLITTTRMAENLGYSVPIAVGTPAVRRQVDTSGPLPPITLPFVEPSHAWSGRMRSETLTERSASHTRLGDGEVIKVPVTEPTSVSRNLRAGISPHVATTKPNIVVEPRPDGRWARQKNGTRRAASLHDTQAAAEEAPERRPNGTSRARREGPRRQDPAA